MKYALAIFDMDGTILDTLDDLADSLNYALKACGYPERSLDEARRFVGNGIMKLIERALPSGSSAAEADRVFSVFMPHYTLHCADKTKPYGGINELLVKLRAAGCRTAVVSNKADHAVQELCTQYFPGLFDAAAGERAGVLKKPAPDSVNEVLSKLGADRGAAVYIGDSEVDIATAKNSGLFGIIVDWGFRDRDFLEAHCADIVVSSTQEVYDIIAG